MSAYRHTARLVFPLSEADYLSRVLGPEIEREIPKCSVRWEREETGGILRIDAEDAGALRAALNSYIRWTYLALKVREETSATGQENGRRNCHE